MPRWLRWRSNVLQAPVVFLVTIICGTLALIVSVFEGSGRLQHRIARIWARGCVVASWSRVKIVGEEKLRQHPIAVYVSNHTSYMDTPVIFASLPFQFRILARHELWKWPFIGWYLKRSGQMPINVDNPQASLSSLGIAAKALRAGMPLFVFPEGGRTPDGELQPFLSGATYLAIRAQVPVVPIALTGVFDLLPIHSGHFFPSEITLRVGEPIETKGKTIRQVAQLTEELRDEIGKLITGGDSSVSDLPQPVTVA